MSAHSAQRSLFDLAAIRQHVCDKVFDRGDAYFQNDDVTLLGVREGTLRARVSGSETYRVALDLGDQRPVRRLVGSCSCPAHVDFGLCKHMVAAAFAANAMEAADAWPQAETPPPTTIETWLGARSKDELVKLVLDLADDDEELERRLLLKAAASTNAADLPSAAAAIGRALRQAAVIPGGYIDYRAMSGWADGLNEVLDAIESVIAPGCSAYLRPLLGDARDHAENAVQNGDDSDGSLTPIFERLDELVLKLRLVDPPEPLDLGRELFGELMDGDDYGHVPMESYWSLLGDGGRDELERLARELWPSVLPKRRGGGFIQEYKPLRHRLFSLLDRIAELRGDLAARIALRREDARSAYDIFRLAEFLIAEGRTLEALTAAEAGHFEFANAPDDRLTGLLAELYRTHGDPVEAEELLWRDFTSRPDMRSFDMLVGSAARKSRVALEEKAILHLQMHSAGQFGAGLLLAILVQTRRFDQAWTLAAAENLQPMRLKSLAEASAASHADTALPVLRLLAAQAVQEGVGGRYGEPLRLIELILMHSNADAAQAETQQWLRDLARDHARKRNFIAGLSACLRSRHLPGMPPAAG